MPCLVKNGSTEEEEEVFIPAEAEEEEEAAPVAPLNNSSPSIQHHRSVSLTALHPKVLSLENVLSVTTKTLILWILSRSWMR